MSETIRFGILGCGGIAERHVTNLSAHERAAIAAVCDVDEAAAQRRAERVRELRPEADPAVLADAHALFGREDVDAVCILLPHHLHYSMAKAALEAGKHVLVEKPMATGPDEARDLGETSERLGLVLGIAYQRATLPAYAHARDLVARGELGDLRLLTAHMDQRWFGRLAAGDSWRTDPERGGGGQLMDTGSHTLAAVLDVTRLTPEEVYARIDHAGAAFDVDTSMVIGFREGPQATVTISGFGLPKLVSEWIRVVGDAGTAEITFANASHQGLRVHGEEVAPAAHVAPSNANHNFVEAIRGRQRVAADAGLGLGVAQLTEAAYRSARENRPARVRA